MGQGLVIALWNVGWAPTGSPRAGSIRAALAPYDPDVVCLTEAPASFLPGGHRVESGADTGYPQRTDRRKVVLWSRERLSEPDATGHPDLPPGRYAAATLDHALGPLRLTGLCVPWRMAHVASGRRDRRPWEDHAAYLRALPPLLASRPRRHVALGDLNQAWPPRRQPAAVAALLAAAVPADWRIATAGVRDGDRAGIDHLIHSPDLAATVVAVLPAVADTGLRRSDHFGLILRVDAC